MFKTRRTFLGGLLALAIFFAALNVGQSELEKSARSEEHTSELQSRRNLVCRLLLEKKNKTLTSLLLLHHKQDIH